MDGLDGLDGWLVGWMSDTDRATDQPIQPTNHLVRFCRFGFVWLIGWLVGWLIDWLVGWMDGLIHLVDGWILVLLD